MGLQEIIDIRETRDMNELNQMERVFEISFLTEATSGRKTLDIPADEYSPEEAEERAREKAEAIDQAVGG